MIRTSLAAILFIASAAIAADQTQPNYPPLPKAISSFGAAEFDGYIYVYGGHSGKTHKYSSETTLGTFLRLPMEGISKESKWEELPGGTGLQGLNLVAVDGKIYRVGGMQARNKPDDEKGDSHSLAEVMSFDPKTKTWSPAPSMPAGRSSHDIVAAGSKIVVVGGWEMKGPNEKSVWHEKALILDTAAKEPKWEAIPQPFKRRALAASALGSKVYVMGGLNEAGETVRAVSILDLVSGKWSDGPEIPGSEKIGFSPASTVVGGKLILNTMDKSVFALNEKGTAWEKVGQTVESRFVHRLVPAGKNAVIAIAGAGPKGAHASIELVRLDGPSPTEKAAVPGAQKYCPVMTEDEIDPKASSVVDYKGVKIYLCCDQCVGKFRRDPAAYLDPKIIPGLAGMELPKRDIEQVFCPVLKDRKISSKDPSTTYKGVKIYFYNDIARQRFEKDPERYADSAILPQLKGK
jgi:YHS domain-containing protein